MITIFVWPGILQGNVGHASMKIESTASLPEEYISWWPAGSGGVVSFLTDQNIPATLHTFDDDDEAEDHATFHSISFLSLDEDRARMVGVLENRHELSPVSQELRYDRG